MITKSDEDDRLWEHVTKTTTPLSGRFSKGVSVQSRTRKEVTFRAEPFIPLPKHPASPSPPPSRTIKQLKRQKIPIQKKLDLHGFTIAQAHIALAAFIKQASQQQIRCVEIITGKGDPERGTGQLRRHVPIWLSEDQNITPFIIYAGENPNARGGSLLVLLRRYKSNA